MGYRSEVLIRAQSPELMRRLNEEELKQLIAPEGMHWIKEIKSYKKDFDTFKWDKSEIYLSADDWKWYDSYDIVKACDALWLFIEELDEELDTLAEDKSYVRPNLDACFIRVGEETGDIDEHSIGNGYDLGYAYSGINAGG